MKHGKLRSPAWFIAFALAVLTLAVYWQVSEFGFLTFDDAEYVKDNPHVHGGVRFKQIGWAFTHSYASNWHPLTWISHMVDWQLFGNDAGAHHLINVAFHVANTLLLFIVLRLLTRCLWRSAFVAGFFALHPAHVESVAWVAERKDVLSTFFALLALLLYARSIKPGNSRGDRPVHRVSVREVGPALLCYAFSLMSKGMYVTLPFVLLLLDWWPLQRLAFDKATGFGRALRDRALEKWPWFGLSFLGVVLTFWAQKTGGAVVTSDYLPLGARLANALVSYARYLGKMIWPENLTVIYPMPAGWAAWKIAAAVALIVVLTFLAYRMARTRPYFVVGWLWFVGTLVPVIGLVQVGRQAMADRYTYFPFIGLFIAVVWGVSDLVMSRQSLRRISIALGVAALLVCAVLSDQQVTYWKNSQVLFKRAVAVTTDNPQAQWNLGWQCEMANELAEARKHYGEAVRLLPHEPDFRKSLGIVLARLGETNAARQEIDQAIGLYLDAMKVHKHRAGNFNSIGVALSALTEFRDAAAAYARAVSLEPDDVVYRDNLGVALARLGDLEGAIAAHREAVRTDPQYASAASNLGAELVQAGRVAEAITYLQKAVSLEPGDAVARANLGGALAFQGRHAEAIPHYQRALKLDPANSKMHLNLGLSLVKVGRDREALTHFGEAARLEPQSFDANYNLGRTLVMLGQGRTAVPPLEAAVGLSSENSSAHFFLGQALAAAGRSAEAKRELREALRLRPDWIDARGALGWLLATDPDAAIRDGEEALRLLADAETTEDQRQAVLLDALAAAYAELGRFDQATATAQAAMAAAERYGLEQLRMQIESRRKLYQARKPFRDNRTE